MASSCGNHTALDSSSQPASEGLAGPDSAAWKINSEVVLLLGWGRAILLQFAHPLVAQGVADHSLFVRSPRLRRRRLVQTVRAMLALTFGTREEAEAAARGINAIHDHVQGHLPDATGRLAAGTTYSAHDPALLRWVHATLLESFPLTYRTFIGTLSVEEEERYHREATGMAPLLGIPEGYLPSSIAERQTYMEQMLASGELVVGETARRLAQELLEPAPWLPGPLRLCAHPVIWLAQLPVVGQLPSDIRAQYGLPWTPRQERVFQVLAALSRRIVPHLPALLRFWPTARHARRRQILASLGAS